MDFGVWPCLSKSEIVFRIGKNGQILETLMKAIVGAEANSQMLTHLVAENRPNRTKKVNRIKCTLKGIAEQNACIGFGLKHKLALFLCVEATYGKQQSKQKDISFHNELNFEILKF